MRGRFATSACISIHSLRMEGDRPSEIQMYNIRISIHSLRMEGDFHDVTKSAVLRDFNPLPPHGGRRLTS